MSGKLIDGAGRPFDGDFLKGCFIDDGFYTPQEPHYKASEMANAEPFDLASTYEQFGNAPIQSNPDAGPGERMLIASKRFYEFCVKNKLKMDWIPVRLDGI
jgi:hypothetical protein